WHPPTINVSHNLIECDNVSEPTPAGINIDQWCRSVTLAHNIIRANANTIVGRGIILNDGVQNANLIGNIIQGCARGILIASGQHDVGNADILVTGNEIFQAVGGAGYGVEIDGTNGLNANIAMIGNLIW